MDFGIYLDAQDWLIKMNPFSTLTKDRFKCPLFFQGLSRFLYKDEILEFLPTRPVHRRKKLKLDKSCIRFESSQVIFMIQV